MVRVATVCLLSGALACGGAASESSSKGASEKEVGAPEADSKVRYPEIPPRGTLVLSGTGGAWKDATFAGSPAEESFSRQSGTLYSQTEPKAEGETPLTYSFGRALTSLSPGEHRVSDGFTVYGLNGGMDSYSFSGNVTVKSVDVAAGVFEFAYVGSLALEGKESAVEGAVNVQVPVGD